MYVYYWIEGAGYVTTQKERDDAEKKTAECEHDSL